MSTFADRWREHLRLAALLLLTGTRADHVLRLLLLVMLGQAPGRAATISLLSDGLMDYGLSPTRDQVETALAWLAEQALIQTIREDGVTGAMVLSRGLDIAAGSATVPGIAAPPTLPWLQGRLEAISLRASMGDIEVECDWLAARNLIKPLNGLVFATHTGRDVALGRRLVEGVKQASPETILRAAANAASNMLRGV
ncbi:MAG: hypothetical protein JXQ84_07820 [Rhodospirillaceae bacterium]|nr:hypothetical protein [Rhodospirillaceae bacterium]